MLGLKLNHVNKRAPGIVYIVIMESYLNVNMVKQCQIIITVCIAMCNTINMISYIVNNKPKIYLIYIRFWSFDNIEPDEIVWLPTVLHIMLHIFVCITGFVCK